jgi:hypothetical protein
MAYWYELFDTVPLPEIPETNKNRILMLEVGTPGR